MRLEGKTAFITAAGQGIGREIAKAFTAQGAAVTATDINADLLKDLEAAPEGRDFELHAAHIPRATCRRAG